MNSLIDMYRRSWEMWGDGLALFLEVGMASCGASKEFIDWFENQHQIDMKLLGLRKNE